MTFMKSAAVAAFVAVAALGSSLTTADAHGKKMHFHGYHHHHHHFKPHFHGHRTIIFSTPAEPCRKWWRRYVRTGNKAFLHRYHACMH